MTCNHLALSLLALLSPTASASAKTYFESDFSDPMSEIVTTNANGVFPGERFYSKGYTESGWTIESVGDKGLCAICPTHNGSGLAHLSRMSTPEIHINSLSAVVRWSACSVAPGFDEAYSVYVETGDGRERTMIFTTDAAPHQWTPHIVSLRQFTGQDIRIVIECHSTDRYMLAIDDLFVGVPYDANISCTNTTSYYARAGERHHITGRLTNLGFARQFTALVCCADGQVQGRMELPGHLIDTGETVSYDLTCNGISNETTEYAVCAERPDGSLVNICDGSFYTTRYPRTILADHTTDITNPRSARVNIVAAKLKQTYGDNIAVISTHKGDDPMEYDSYLHNIGFTRDACIMLNRNPQHTGDTERSMRGLIGIPTDALFRFSEVSSDDELTASLTLSATFAKKLDNSDDRYRIGYTLTADMRLSDNGNQVERNSAGTAGSMRHYYFMPTEIPAELTYLANVNVGPSDTETGISASLPAHLDAGETYLYKFDIMCPDAVDKITDTTVVAYIIDTETGLVLNAATASPANPTGNATTVTDSMTAHNDTLSVEIMPAGQCRITRYPDRTVTVAMHTPDGCLIRHQAIAPGNGAAVIPLESNHRGPVIVTATDGRTTVSAKYLMRQNR